MGYQPIPEEDEAIARGVIGAAIEVHRVLGPGFLESVYERALMHELQLRRLPAARQHALLVIYKELPIQEYRLDLLVGGRVIVEVKAVDSIGPIHEAQLLSYLKASSLRVGLIINFNVVMLRDGIRRLVR
ncbi:MAG: GxxExxY protein [Pirellulales bacterium]|nr:GxxExxY protein [Pirellulales bacterium]